MTWNALATTSAPGINPTPHKSRRPYELCRRRGRMPVHGRDDRGLVRWFVRNNPRHPSRHVLTVGAILLTELLPQRGLFLDHHDCKREEPKEHAPRRHPFVAEQQRLAQ